MVFARDGAPDVSLAMSSGSHASSLTRCVDDGSATARAPCRGSDPPEYPPANGNLPKDEFWLRWPFTRAGAP